MSSIPSPLAQFNEQSQLHLSRLVIEARRLAKSCFTDPENPDQRLWPEMSLLLKDVLKALTEKYSSLDDYINDQQQVSIIPRGLKEALVDLNKKLYHDDQYFTSYEFCDLFLLRLHNYIIPKPHIVADLLATAQIHNNAYNRMPTIQNGAKRDHAIENYLSVFKVAYSSLHDYITKQNATLIRLAEQKGYAHDGKLLDLATMPQIQNEITRLNAQIYKEDGRLNYDIAADILILRLPLAIATGRNALGQMPDKPQANTPSLQ